MGAGKERKGKERKREGRKGRKKERGDLWIDLLPT